MSHARERAPEATTNQLCALTHLKTATILPRYYDATRTVFQDSPQYREPVKSARCVTLLYDRLSTNNSLAICRFIRPGDGP